MPLYFVDIDNGEQWIWDDEGSRCDDLAPARREMMRTLLQLARDASPDRGQFDLVGRIRDAAGRTLCEATLSLNSTPAL